MFVYRYMFYIIGNCDFYQQMLDGRGYDIIISKTANDNSNDSNNNNIYISACLI